jgi:hypothetical protein
MLSTWLDANRSNMLNALEDNMNLDCVCIYGRIGVVGEHFFVDENEQVKSNDLLINLRYLATCLLLD